MGSDFKDLQYLVPVLVDHHDLSKGRLTVDYNHGATLPSARRDVNQAPVAIFPARLGVRRAA